MDIWSAIQPCWVVYWCEPTSLQSIPHEVNATFHLWFVFSSVTFILYQFLFCFFLHFSLVQPLFLSLIMSFIRSLHPPQTVQGRSSGKDVCSGSESARRLTLSGDSTQLYFEIHHVSSCGLSKGDGYCGLKAVCVCVGGCWCFGTGTLSSCLP